MYMFFYDFQTLQFLAKKLTAIFGCLCCNALFEMSGYGCKFVHPLLKRHECPLCHLAMRNPMQTECGHLFCKECLEQILKLRPPLCPLDNDPVSREGVSVAISGVQIIRYIAYFGDRDIYLPIVTRTVNTVHAQSSRYS